MSTTNNNQMIKYALATLAFIIMVNILFVVSHENAHKQVFQNHGCLDVQITYEWTKATTECLEWRNVSKEMLVQNAQMQSWIEIIGYHLYAFLILMIFMVIKK